MLKNHRSQLIGQEQIFQYHGGTLLPNHDTCRIDVGPHQLWHDGGIHNPQSLYPVNTEPMVDNRVVSSGTHAASPDGMVAGSNVLPSIAFQVGIRLGLMTVPAQHLILDDFYPALLEGLRVLQFFDKLHAFGEGADITRVVKVVGVDDGRVINAGTAQVHRAAALGSGAQFI